MRGSTKYINVSRTSPRANACTKGCLRKCLDSSLFSPSGVFFSRAARRFPNHRRRPCREAWKWRSRRRKWRDGSFEGPNPRESNRFLLIQRLIFIANLVSDMRHGHWQVRQKAYITSLNARFSSRTKEKSNRWFFPRGDYNRNSSIKPSRGIALHTWRMRKMYFYGVKCFWWNFIYRSYYILFVVE